jgi:hypothetical protein
MAAPKETSDGKTHMHIYYARHPSHHQFIKINIVMNNRESPSYFYHSHVVGLAQTNPGSDVTGWLEPSDGWDLPLQKTRKYVSIDCLDWEGPCGKFCHY